jgi:WhiB family redox-sensing transcriptional regulator
LPTHNDDPEWTFRYEAKCRQNTWEHEVAAVTFDLISHRGLPQVTELWYPPRDRERYRPIAEYSKGVCNGKDGRPPCPVRAECLREAIESDEVHGIFGGYSHRERNALMRKLVKQDRTLDDFLEDW